MYYQPRNLNKKSFNSLSYRNSEITQNYNNDCDERLNIEFPCTKEKSVFVLKKKVCNIYVCCIQCENVNFPWCSLVLWKPFLVGLFVVVGVLFTVTVLVIMLIHNTKKLLISSMLSTINALINK